MPAFIVLPFISLICFITAICLTLNMIINIRKQGKNRKNEREMKKQNHNRVISLVAALCTYVAGGVACFNINIPKPVIYPLNSQTTVYSDTAEITIGADAFLTTYYTLDGTDPEYGDQYDNAIIISESTTVCSRNRFLFWWSELEKSAYLFEKNNNDMKSNADTEDMDAESYLELLESYLQDENYDMALEYAREGYERTGDKQLREIINELEKKDVPAASKLTKRVGYNEKGDIEWQHEFEYNIQGQRTSVAYYDKYGNQVSRIHFTYNDYGDSTNDYWWIVDDGDIRLVKYFYQDHILIRLEEYNDVSDNQLTYYIIYQYDHDGKIVKETDYDGDGTLIAYYEYEYDSYGRERKCSRFIDEEDGFVLEDYEITEYNSNGDVIKHSHYEQDGDDVRVYFYETYDYDENNRCIRETYYDGGTMSDYVDYEYDSNGVLINSKGYDCFGRLLYEEFYI